MILAELGVKRSSASLVTSVGFNSLLVPFVRRDVKHALDGFDQQFGQSRSLKLSWCLG